MRIKQTLLGVLVLGSALSAACGEDKKPGVVTPTNGGTNQGNGAGSTDEEGGVPIMDAGTETGGDAATFPNDKTGPTIMFKQPSSAAGKVPIVGGTVEVIVAVKDEESGVEPRKVSATIKKSKEEIIDLDPTVVNGDFVFTFEAADYEDRADLNMTVQAMDKAGNETTAALLMELDTRAPWVSLDPPDLRFYSLVKTDYVCSGNFDPLGEAVADGEVVLKEARFRAFIWDRALEFPGQEEYYYAGVNEARVELLAQDDAKSPLLTDGADKDEACDSVNDEGAEVVRLDPIKSAGTPVFGDNTAENEPDYSLQCAGLTQSKPSDMIKKLCSDRSDLQYVPTHDVQGGASVVFAVGTTSTGDACTGTTWDSLTRGGWTCVVVRAWDKAATDGVGNLGFSKPIRVCRKLADTDCEGAAKGTILTPPKTLTCTDGCTLPDEVINWGHAPFVTKR